jgi:glutathione S-transferase
VAEYELLYWSVPFRGQFVRAVLAYAGKSWSEPGDGKISALMAGKVSDMPVPFMGPPVLIDNQSGFALSQMPAIIYYLGDSLGLLPTTPQLRGMTLKVVNDANDVIDELTLNGGRDMWTEERWQRSIPRIEKWMTMWEELGRRHGLADDTGFLLGGDHPALADVITATLWTTISDRFSRLKTLLVDTAPRTMALSERISSLPALAELRAKARSEYGDAYAGGQIGASMKTYLNE